MGKLTRKINPDAKSGFEPYDGDEPKPGLYRARIINVKLRKAQNTDSIAYNVFYELQAVKPEHKQYDGFSGFAQLWLGDAEALQARELQFTKAVTGKLSKSVDDVNVVFEGTEKDFATASGALVTKIDGVNPEGKIVKVRLQVEKAQGEYPARLVANDIYPTNEEPKKGATADEAPSQYEDDEDTDGGEEGAGAEVDAELEAEKEARRVELRSRKYGIDKLRAAAEDAGVDTDGMKKEALVEAIVEFEFSDEDEDADADDADDSDDAEPDTDDTDDEDSDDEDDDDEESDDDEDDEDDEDEEEEDPEPAIRAELEGLNRVQIKAYIKGIKGQEGFTAKKSQSDEDLLEYAVAQKLTEPPF